MQKTPQRNFIDSESRATLQHIAGWAKTSGSKSLLLLDLDSTVIDTSYRTQAIFRKFAQEHQQDTLYRELCSGVEAWPDDLYEVYDPIDFVYEHIPGLTLSKACQKYVHDYWRSHFFRPVWFDHDRPFSHAVDFIQDMAQYVSIAYLTGRCDKTLRSRTEKQLQEHNLPFCSSEHLVMKSSSDIKDLIFKDEGLQSYQKYFQDILYIENEVELVTMSLEKHPNIQTVLFDSVHSGRGCLTTQPITLRSWV